MSSWKILRNNLNLIIYDKNILNIRIIHVLTVNVISLSNKHSYLNIIISSVYT